MGSMWSSHSEITSPIRDVIVWNINHRSRVNVSLYYVDVWSRYWFSFIKTEAFKCAVSNLLSSPVKWKQLTNKRQTGELFQAYVSMYRAAVSGERRVLNVLSVQWIEMHYVSCHQGEPVGVRLSLVALLRPPQHPPLPAAVLPHHSSYHCQHHGQVQRHKTGGESGGQF